jgi:hypothetical protein
MKSVVTISRYWNSPKITTSVSKESISLSMDMEDFISALKTEIGFSPVIEGEPQEILAKLKAEVGSVTWVFKDETFENQLTAAFNKVVKESKIDTQVETAIMSVLEKVKEESIKVI